MDRRIYQPQTSSVTTASNAATAAGPRDDAAPPAARPGTTPPTSSARGAPVVVEFEGAPYRAYAGEPLAVALFAGGVGVLSRSIKYHRPRAFFCLAGHCGACLMRVDGVPNVRACMVPCREGLQAEGQNAFPTSDVDLLGAVDFMFPKGMDHHTLMTGSRLANQVMQKVVEKLAGLGRLPEHDVAEYPEVRARRVDVAVVGGGPAGLAAATAAARAGARTLVIDEGDHPGGSLLGHPGLGPAEAARLVETARAVGVDVLTDAPAIAWYPEDDGGLLAVATPGGLVRLQARRWIYATGAHDVNAPFADNDRPGVLAARAVGRLTVRHGVRPGRRVVILGEGDLARRLATALGELGVEVVAVDGIRERVVRARGGRWIEAVEIETDGGRRVEPCDALAVAVRPAPASEAPRTHGAAVRLSEEAGGYAVVVDGDGRTSVPGVFACGDVTGYVGPARAADHGAHVGAVAGREAIAP